MSATDASAGTSTGGPAVGAIDMKLEVITVPVADVDRAKAFYEGLGWRVDADIARGDAFRVVQLTPPHSGCSISLAKGLSAAFGVDRWRPAPSSGWSSSCQTSWRHATS